MKIYCHFENNFRVVMFNVDAFNNIIIIIIVVGF